MGLTPARGDRDLVSELENIGAEFMVFPLTPGLPSGKGIVAGEHNAGRPGCTARRIGIPRRNAADGESPG